MIRISILTPSYQQGKYLEQNIQSVLAQNYPECEHIVIDGGSTDETVDVLKRHPHVHWVSEKDEGQGDAVNKGLNLAKGEIIGWINSDDYYLPGAFEAAAKFFADPKVQWVVGNIITDYEAIGKQVSIKSPTVTYERLLIDPDIVKQQATFFRRSFLEKAGGIDKQYHMVMDLDLWIRLARLAPPLMVDEYWAVFRMQPKQKTLGRNLLAQLREIQQLYRRERAPMYIRSRIYFRKTLYYLKYKLKLFLIQRGVINDAFAGVPYRMHRRRGEA